MTTKVKLKNGGAIEVRIEKGQIAEITYLHGTTITAKRENRAEIEFRMKNIFEDNVDEFKKLLKRIESDEDFYSYGRSLLDTKIEALLEAIITTCKRVVCIALKGLITLPAPKDAGFHFVQALAY